MIQLKHEKSQHLSINRIEMKTKFGPHNFKKIGFLAKKKSRLSCHRHKG